MTGDAFRPTGRVASILLGSLAVLITVPTGVGSAIGDGLRVVGLLAKRKELPQVS